MQAAIPAGWRHRQRPFDWCSLTYHSTSETVPVSVAERLRWYTKNCKRARRLLISIDLVILLLSASVTVAAAFSASKVPPVVLGSAMSFLVGVRGITGWAKSSAAWADAMTDIQREIVLWHEGVAPYANEVTAAATLAVSVEAIVASETRGWLQRVLQSEDSPTKNSSDK